MKYNYIAYDAGGVWVVEKYNQNKHWHNNEYRGTERQCRTYCLDETHGRMPVKHYSEIDLAQVPTA